LTREGKKPAEQSPGRGGKENKGKNQDVGTLQPQAVITPISGEGKTEKLDLNRKKISKEQALSNAAGRRMGETVSRGMVEKKGLIAGEAECGKEKKRRKSRSQSKGITKNPIKEREFGRGGSSHRG